MTEQARILDEISKIVMKAFKEGTVSMEESIEMGKLEDALHEQPAFLPSGITGRLQGEQIADLFFANRFDEGIERMCSFGVTAEDFFSFVDYHYDEDHDDEEKTEMFTQEFMVKVKTAYVAKCSA